MRVIGLALVTFAMGGVAHANPCCSQCDGAWDICYRNCTDGGGAADACEAACDHAEAHCYAHCSAECALEPSRSQPPLAVIEDAQLRQCYVTAL
jgi:hypothetical protein